MQNAEYGCAYCGETNLTFVDFSAGSNQSYVEDCQVCCQPNILSICWDEGEEVYCVDSEPES